MKKLDTATDRNAKAQEDKTAARVNSSTEAGAATNSSSNSSSMFCGPGCVFCPPGTHDAGTCQPPGKCGYNGIIGEMMEHIDHCGGSAVGNPMMGGGNMMSGMMGYGNPGMMNPGMMNPGMMYPGMR